MVDCKCRNKHRKIISIISKKRKAFEVAFEHGPTPVRAVKFKIIQEINKVLGTSNLCNCFLGQNLQKIAQLLSTYFANYNKYKKELNHTAFENEKDKIYDKISLILNTN